MSYMLDQIRNAISDLLQPVRWDAAKIAHELDFEFDSDERFGAAAAWMKFRMFLSDDPYVAVVSNKNLYLCNGAGVYEKVSPTEYMLDSINWSKKAIHNKENDLDRYDFGAGLHGDYETTEDFFKFLRKTFG